MSDIEGDDKSDKLSVQHPLEKQYDVEVKNQSSRPKDTTRNDEKKDLTEVESKEPGDLESGNNTKSKPEDPNLVTWDGPNDPTNPKTWSFKRKWIATGLVSLITFMSPMSTSMIAPAAGVIADEFHIQSTIQIQLVFSIMLLAFVIGPLFLAPLSEIYGRVIVLQLANAFFLAFTLGCGFAQNEGEILAFRFLSGLGACAPQSVGGGVLGDLWAAEERGMAIALYSLAPLLGPALGPIIGAWVTEKSTWRWSFWSICIFGVAVQVLIALTMPETYGPRILFWKAQKLRKETGNQDLHTEYEGTDRRLRSVLKKGLVRPFKLLTTQPIVQFLALWISLIYGMTYIVLSTYPNIWTDIYHESIGIGGLNYISIMIGLWLGAQLAGRVSDWSYRKLKEKSANKVGRPEFRVPGMFIAIFFLTAGLIIYGWSAQFHTHWIVPNIGAALFSAGGAFAFTAIQTYAIDAYTLYAASAISALAVVRSLFAFGFPLFAPQMYQSLGWGWGNTLLALVILGIGNVGAIVLWFYGERLRARSPYAAGT